MRGMRALRNFKPDRCYHLISRIANRAFYLTDDERTRFVERLWRVAKFSGIEVLAYCFMSNHFHLLVHLPEADGRTARGSRNRQREFLHGPLPDAACEVGIHRGCWRREESLSARQAVQDFAQGKGGGPCLTPPLQPHHWGLSLGVLLANCFWGWNFCTKPPLWYNVRHGW